MSGTLSWAGQSAALNTTILEIVRIMPKVHLQPDSHAVGRGGAPETGGVAPAE